MATTTTEKRPAFIPLEANPELMTTLLHKLGVSPALAVHDVYSLHDPDLLAFVPRPALAVLLVFPVSEKYEAHRREEDEAREEYQGSGDGEGVVWFRQTIRNACGLMGLLHAVANGPARGFIVHPPPPGPRSALLETNTDLATAHLESASRGATAAPGAEDDVDLHYVCFVKTEDGKLWELDGRRKGPIERGVLAEGEDVLSEAALREGPLAFLAREGDDLRFSCVALAGALD